MNLENTAQLQSSPQELLDWQGGPSAYAGRSTRKDVSWSNCVVAPSLDYGLGLRFRGAVAGPEQALVEAFLEAATTRLAPGRRLTVFAQPAIETGFPDLVAVVWRSGIARSWAAERERLKTADLRVLHLLATKGAIELTFLRRAFHRGLHAILTRMEEAGVIAIGRVKCWARSPSKAFAVERIIAVEAKMSVTQRALEQASTNTWYSSESHALFPRLGAVDPMKDMASAFGVGVIGFTQDRVAQIHEASIRAVPLSYGSWLFNEWTWRVARRQGTI